MQTTYRWFAGEHPRLPPWFIERTVRWAYAHQPMTPGITLSSRLDRTLSAYTNAARIMEPLLHPLVAECSDNIAMHDRLRDKMLVRLWERSARRPLVSCLAKNLQELCGPYPIPSSVADALTQLRAGIPYERIPLYRDEHARQHMIAALAEQFLQWTPRAIEAVVAHVERRDGHAITSDVERIMEKMDHRLCERIDPYLMHRLPDDDAIRRKVRGRLVREMLGLSHGAARHVWQPDYLIALTNQMILAYKGGRNTTAVVLAQAHATARYQVAVGRAVDALATEFPELPGALVRRAVTLIADKTQALDTVQSQARILLQRWSAQIDTHLQPQIVAYHPKSAQHRADVLAQCLTKIAKMPAAAFVPGNSIWYPRNLRVLVARVVDSATLLAGDASFIRRIASDIVTEFPSLPTPLVHKAIAIVLTAHYQFHMVKTKVRTKLQIWHAVIEAKLIPWIAAYYPSDPDRQRTALLTCLRQIAAMDTTAFGAGNSIWHPHTLRALVARVCEGGKPNGAF